jgi:hypothetical protein
VGELLDFVHYQNSGELVTVPPCDSTGHNIRHVVVYEYGDGFFISCNLCHEASVGWSTDDFYAFMRGKSQVRHPSQGRKD